MLWRTFHGRCVASQFGGVKFQPLLPGLVAILSLIVTMIVGNLAGPLPEEVAIPAEMATCAVSLVWGLAQTRKNGDTF